MYFYLKSYGLRVNAMKTQDILHMTKKIGSFCNILHIVYIDLVPEPSSYKCIVYPNVEFLYAAEMLFSFYLSHIQSWNPCLNIAYNLITIFILKPSICSSAKPLKTKYIKQSHKYDTTVCTCRLCYSVGFILH